MLQSIRDNTKGWIAYVIIGLLIVPFALFGVYNYFTGGSNPAVAQVNGNDITRTALDNAYQQQQNRLRQMLKDRYDPAMFDESTMRRQALDQLINQAVLSDFVRNNGFQISNDALLAVIRQQQFFQVDGKFSPDRYRNVLKQNGMTPDQYESRLRHDQMVNQLQQAVAGSAVVTNRDLARFVALQMQKRQLSWIRIKAASFRDQVDVGDKDIKTYYDKHRDAFQRPEQVKLSYIELSPETLSGQIKVSDEELKDRYEQVKDTKYTQPGQRKVSHILVQVPQDADDAAVAAAKERIEKARQRIVQGDASFADVARDVSEDPGSKKDGGSLGYIRKGDTVAPFEKVAFSLPKGKVSEPVRTKFGWHLIEVTDIQPPTTKPFAEVKDEIRKHVAKEKAANRLLELGNKMANLAYENPDSLQPAAEAVGVKVEHSGWVSRQGSSDGVAANPKVLKAAFSDDVLKNGLNSQLVELDDKSQVVVRVSDHRPAEVQPLDEVRDRVRDRLIGDRTADLAASRGKELVKKAEQGAALADLASGPAATFQDAGWVGRGGGKLPPAVRDRAFRMDSPEDDKPTVAGVELGDGDYAVVGLHGIRDGELSELKDAEREQLRTQLQRQNARTSLQDMLAALRENADVTIHEDRL